MPSKSGQQLQFIYDEDSQMHIEIENFFSTLLHTGAQTQQE